MAKERKISGRATKPFRVVLPASSANLGPAFDAAAIALNLYLKVTARPHSHFVLSAAGRDPEICGKQQDHLLLATYSTILQQEHKPVLPLSLRLENEIPVGKGCGSSAAARLAGIALAVHFGKLSWNTVRIVTEASRLEHHPDNAAACWLGGLAVARVAEDGAVQWASHKPKGDWPLLLVVPPQGLPTEKARRVLPAQYSRGNAVINIQNSMLLLSAFVQGRPELLAGALQDRLHQPYRAALCPLLTTMKKLAGTPGILGTVLSGAGPSVLVFLEPGSALNRVRKRVEKHLQQEGLSAELIAARVSMRAGCAGLEPKLRSRARAAKFGNAFVRSAIPLV
ncbi:MAG TPA: homoserine kinase [Terriglobales bacterium]|nr:homoserine kinase [Terriglobales bacterium]